MINPDFNDGLPKPYLDRSAKVDSLQEVYGNFSTGVLLQIRQADSNAPDDILCVGGNWFQLSTTRAPKNQFEGAIQKQTGDAIFGDTWPLMGRRSGEDIYALLGSLQEGIRAGTVDARLMRKLAVLDLAQDNPAVRPEYLDNPVDTPWGRNGTLINAGTFVYHITSGYARQRVERIYGEPGDNPSAAIHWYGQRKEL